MKKRVFSILLALILALCAPGGAFAHSGRTDSSGGHKDNQNKSGLGSYHYHCGGNPPHLHDNGCPYSSASAETQRPASNPTAMPTATPTVKPTERPAPKTTAQTVEATPTEPAISADTPRSSLVPDSVLPADGILQFGKTTVSEVNVREGESKSAKLAGKTDGKGTRLIVLEEIKTSAGETWYRIWHNNKESYILGSFVTIITMEEYLEGK